MSTELQFFIVSDSLGETQLSVSRTARGGCWRAFGRGGDSRGFARCCTMLCKSDRFRLLEIRRKYFTSNVFKYHNDRDRAHIPSYIRRLSNVLYRICVNFSECGLISMKRERKKCVVNHSLCIFSFQSRPRRSNGLYTSLLMGYGLNLSYYHAVSKYIQRLLSAAKVLESYIKKTVK